MTNSETTDVQVFETAVQTVDAEQSKVKQEKDFEPDAKASEDDIRTKELKDAKAQALAALKDEKYKAKLIVKQAKLKAKVADMNIMLFELKKELDFIAKELKELDERK